MPTLRDLRNRFEAVRGIEFSGWAQLPELSSALVSAKREFDSLRAVVGDIIKYLEENEPSKGA